MYVPERCTGTYKDLIIASLHPRTDVTMGLWSILRKPNRLADFPDEGYNRVNGLKWYLTTTRGQVTVLHTVASVYVVVFCLLVCWASVCLGLPILYKDSPDGLMYARALMIYICFCIESNYLLIKFRAKESHVLTLNNGELPRVNVTKTFNDHMSQPVKASSSSYSRDSSAVVDTTWTRCTHCNVDVPPRARHCSVCQTCVLKKDHHCFFTGCCVGFYNQRYFITFCVLGIIGGTWGLYNLGTYLTINYAPMLSLQMYRYFLPYSIIGLLIGHVSLYDFFLVLLFYLHITSTATSYYYFAWQMFIISRGQTSYECVKRKHVYKKDFWAHMRSVFGPYWLVGFVFPMPFIVNEGDGRTWEMNKKHS